eukprot:TRINITY_DN39022_c0_g1_i1.p1 TRINITY_DN39022_c0_g1~~TRINITY_DN39022_c0_g1_i1.p1  ORF type:complete len:294 (+),score=60.19 TRINITY_DN39022_c0_g1_i1:143-1024(+)
MIFSIFSFICSCLQSFIRCLPCYPCLPSLHCLPASQFCCGCSVSFGVKLVLFWNFVGNLYQVIHVAMAVTHTPTSANVDWNRLNGEIAMAGFCLAGLPIIVMGMWGAFRRIESLLRVYFYYEVLMVLIFLWLCLKQTVLSNPCKHMPDMLESNGSAVGCGIMRGAVSTIFVFFTGIEIYLVFIVWSYCEDLAEAGADLAVLSKDILGYPLSQHALMKKRLEADPPTSMFGLEGSPDGNIAGNCCIWSLNAVCCGAYANPYSMSAENSGLEDSRTLFGRTYHEMQYPPPHRAMM